jgi:hypothetical protein
VRAERIRRERVGARVGRDGVVGEAGALVPPRDVEAWKNQLVRIVEDEAWRADLAQKGLRPFGENWRMTREVSF